MRVSPLVAGIVAFFTVLVAAVPARGEGPPLCGQRSAVDLLAELLGVPSEPAAVKKAVQERNHKLDFLLATTPDPMLGMTTTWKPIARALEQSGYVKYSSWERWDRPDDAPEKTRPEHGAAPALCQEQHPGVVLFLHLSQGHAPAVLVLFLIGETPNSGIYQAAFRAAVKDIARVVDLEQKKRDDPKKQDEPKNAPVRIVGPTFSGSATSLRIAVKAIPAILGTSEEPRVAIISGSATRRDIKDVLEGRAAPGLPKDPAVTFSATVVPDDMLLAEFNSYLTATLHADANDIAVLVESNTSYGQGFKQTPRLVLPFPQHIGQRHTAPDREAAEQRGDPAAHPASSDSGKQTGVHTKEKDIDDQVLANILTVISSESIRYVGIIATSTDDKRFLAWQVRTYCPDVALFTVETDILLTRPEDRQAFKGMIVASTYPLFAQNQHWSFPFGGAHQRLQLAHSSEEGTYNATLLLLGDNEHLLEYSLPFIEQEDIKGHGLRPPVWISAVGNDGLVPLYAKATEDDGGGFIHEVTATEATKPFAQVHKGSRYSPAPWVWNLAVLVLCGLCFINCIAYFKIYYATSEHDPPYPWRLFDFYRRVAGDANGESWWQGWYLLACFVPLLLVQLLLAFLSFDVRLSFYIRPANIFPGGDFLGREGMAWGSALLVSSCLILLFLALADITRNLSGQRKTALWAVARPLARDKSDWRAWGKFWGWVLGPGLLLALLVLLALAALSKSEHFSLPTLIRGILLFWRTVNVAYGLSPAVPVLLLGSVVYLWGFCNLRRIRLLEDLDPAKLEGLLNLKHWLGDCHLKMMDYLKSPFPQRGYLLACLAVGLFFIWIIRGLITLEARWLDRVFFGLFVLAPMAIIFSFARLLYVWYHLRRILCLLVHHPMVNAFDRLPLVFSRPFGIQLVEEVPAWVELEELKRHYHHLRNHLGHVVADLQGDSLAGLRALIDKQRQKVEDGAEPNAKAWGSFFAELTREMVDVVDACFWKQRPLKSTLEGDVLKKDPAGLLIMNTVSFHLRAMPDSVHFWFRLAEDFIAIQVVAYVNRLFLHLRNLLVFVTVGMLLLLAALNVYPFQPRHFLMIMTWVLILSVVVSSLFIFVQMNRNEVLSRIAKSQPGEVTWSWTFVSNLLVYGALPLVSLAAAQFPDVRAFLFSWVEPALRALK